MPKDISRDTTRLAKGITANPHICGGKPVLEGTRIPVSMVIGSLSSGMTEKEMLEEYDVTPKQIRAALAYASQILAEQRFVPLPSR